MVFADLKGWILAARMDDERPVDLRWPYGHIILFIFLLCALIFTRWSLLMSPALLQDDVYFISQLLRSELRPTSVPVFDWIIFSLLDMSANPVLVRIVLAVVLSVCGVMLYDLFRLSNRAPVDCFIIASIATLTPVGITQVLFISGSHPIVALPFCLIAFRVVIEILKSESPLQIIILSVLAGALFLMADFASSTALLMSLATLLFVFDSPHVLRGLKRFSLAFTAITPMAIVFFVQLNYPSMRKSYFKVEGWIDVSISNLISQSLEATGILFEYYITDEIWMNLIIFLFVFIPAGVLIWNIQKLQTAFWAIRKPTFTGSSVFIVLLFLLASALSFGPPSAAIFITPRYLMVPTFFGLSFILIFAYELFGKTRLRTILLRAAGIGVVAVSIAGLANGSASKFGVGFALQEEVIRFVKTEETRWKEHAQVVVMLNWWAMGFPEAIVPWSSELIRYAADRRDLIGLVGVRNEMTEDPIRSEKVSWWGPEYWSTKDGKANYIKMAGLTMERPTYFYSWDGGATLVESGYMMVDGGDKGAQLFEAKTGERLRLIADANEESICAILSAFEGQVPIFGPMPLEQRPYCDKRNAN